MRRVCGVSAVTMKNLLFTVTAALLVAVPCWLVATALYSAVSLTTHLKRTKVRKRVGTLIMKTALFLRLVSF